MRRCRQFLGCALVWKVYDFFHQRQDSRVKLRGDAYVDGFPVRKTNFPSRLGRSLSGLKLNCMMMFCSGYQAVGQNYEDRIGKYGK